MPKPIHCDKCSREIKYRSDLVTAPLSYKIVTYHQECFAQNIRGKRSFFLHNEPLNSTASNFRMMAIFILTIGWLFYADGLGKLIALLALLPISYRLYSYFAFERHIEK